MLDGGYILFILVEMITRRKVPERVVYYANYVGLFLILGLMIYANTDFLRD
jgi:regulator of sigma E protease